MVLATRRAPRAGKKEDTSVGSIGYGYDAEPLSRKSAMVRESNTYSIAGSELLLRVDGASSSSSSIQGRVATNHSLALSGAASTSAATNLGGGIPILRHFGGGFPVFVVKMCAIVGMRSFARNELVALCVGEEAL